MKIANFQVFKAELQITLQKAIEAISYE